MGTKPVNSKQRERTPPGVSGAAHENRCEVRLAGFGGQGIVLAGNILGKAVVLYEGRNAVFTQSYGPEARGGACSADVVVSDEVIHYPKVTRPDVLVFMSEEARHTYGNGIAADTVVLCDEDLVKTEELRDRVPRLHTADLLPDTACTLRSPLACRVALVWVRGPQVPRDNHNPNRVVRPSKTPEACPPTLC